MRGRRQFTVGQWVGTFIFILTSTVPGMSLAGFQGGTAWSLAAWLPIAAIGGFISGALLARSHRFAGAVGGLLAGPAGLLAIFFYARGRDRMYRAETVIVQLVACLPGLGVFFLLRLITDAIFPPELDESRTHADDRD
jgi:hypothetical protein